MRNILLSILTMLVTSNMLVAGGELGTKMKDVEPAISPVVAVIDEDNYCDFYLGGGIIYNRVYHDNQEWFNDQQGTQDETGGLVLLAGCQLHENIAVEGRYTWTEWDQDYSDMTSYSIFLKPIYPVSEDFSIYGLVGFGNSKVVGSKGDPNNAYSAWPGDIGKTMMDEYSFHWGFGASYFLTSSLAIFAEFTSTADDIDIEATRLYDYDDEYYEQLSTDGLTVGLTYHF